MAQVVREALVQASLLSLGQSLPRGFKVSVREVLTARRPARFGGSGPRRSGGPKRLQRLNQALGSRQRKSPPEVASRYSGAGQRSLRSCSRPRFAPRALAPGQRREAPEEKRRAEESFELALSFGLSQLSGLVGTQRTSLHMGIVGLVLTKDHLPSFQGHASSALLPRGASGSPSTYRLKLPSFLCLAMK